MSESIEKMTRDNVYFKLKIQDLRIQEEIRRISELNKLLESNEEIYQLASYSRRNVRMEYVSESRNIRQMDKKLEETDCCLREIQEYMVQAIHDLVTLTEERLKLNLCISRLSAQEQYLLKCFVNERPIRELEEELNCSERTIKRRKQEIALRLEELYYSGNTVKNLLNIE